MNDKYHRIGGARLLSDRESTGEREIIALYPEGRVASCRYISRVGQTVAELNPNYPQNDPVVAVVFVKSIESKLCTEWRLEDVMEHVASGSLSEMGIRIYSYPESRLVPSTID